MCLRLGRDRYLTLGKGRHILLYQFGEKNETPLSFSSEAFLFADFPENRT